jgi:hypothetical protein
MNPGKKLTINGKSLHEYDYLNVSDKNVAKNFNFKEVIVKYFLRWVHFPKLETQCELYSKKTNALLIIQVADYTEKWDKFWTRRDPKTSRCATDYCYVVDFQVDPQRLEILKAELKGKKLPEEINGRVVLYARSNVQPREDKFKSPLNMYESFMRKEDPKPQPTGQYVENNSNGATGAEDNGIDLVFSPRATDPTAAGTPPKMALGTLSPPTTSARTLSDSRSQATVQKKDSLQRLRTASNWAASRPSKSSLSSINLGTPVGGTDDPNPALTSSTGGKVDSPKLEPVPDPQSVQQAPTVPNPEVPQVQPQVDVQPQAQTDVEPPTLVVEPQIVVEQPQAVNEPPQVIIDEPQVEEPIVPDAPQIVVQEPIKKKGLNGDGRVEITTPSKGKVEVQQPQLESPQQLDVEQKSTTPTETTPRNPNETSPRPTPQHVDFNEPDLSMDSTVAPSFFVQQQMMNNGSSNATVQNDTPPQRQAQLGSPIKTGERPVSAESRPVGRRTSVSDMPQFKRYTTQAGESPLPKQPPKFAAAKANTSAISSPQGSPKFGLRKAVIAETKEQHEIEVNTHPADQITAVAPTERLQPLASTGLTGSNTQPSERAYYTPQSPSQGDQSQVPPNEILSQPPQRQTFTSPGANVYSRPTIQPPQPPTDVASVQAQPPKMAPNQPPQSQPSPLNLPPRQLPPQPKSGGQLRPQPPTQIHIQPQTQQATNPRTFSNPPQPQPELIEQPITRPLAQPPQTHPSPPQENDDIFQEPLMETYRPVPPKPWKVIGVRKIDNV